jgi:hypothetical protein
MTDFNRFEAGFLKVFLLLCVISAGQPRLYSDYRGLLDGHLEEFHF